MNYLSSSSSSSYSSGSSSSASDNEAPPLEILDKEITDLLRLPKVTTSSESSPKRTKTNKKKEYTPFRQRTGRNFVTPLVDIAARTTVGLSTWDPLKAYCDNDPNLSSPLPIATDAKSLENISIMIIKHFPGDVNLEKMIEYGLLWKTKNDYIGEPCLRFLVSFINKMLYAFPDDNTRRKINDSIAWWDICPVPGPNNCGGDHKHDKLQNLTTEVLIQFLKKCPNLKHILFFGKDPNIYSMEQFLPQLEKRAPQLLPAFQPTFRLGSPDFNSLCKYNPHSQFYLMGFNTKEHTMNLIRVGADIINTVFKIDITQQLMQLNDDDVQEIIPFATGAVIEARRLVMSQVMKDHWANPDGPFRNVSQLMKAHWANPDGPFRNVSQLMKAHWANPDGPFRNVSQLMKDQWANPNSVFRLGWADPESKFWEGREQASQKMIALWADPEGPFRNVSQLMIDFHNASYSHRQPCPHCGILIRGNYGTGMASHLRACQGGKKNPSYIDEMKSHFGGNLPHMNDIIVMTGRLTMINQWKGNLDYQVLITEASSSYHTSVLSSEKNEIINAIINKIKKSNGKFVVYSIYKKNWEQQSERNSRAKILRSLKALE